MRTPISERSSSRVAMKMRYWRSRKEPSTSPPTSGPAMTTPRLPRMLHKGMLKNPDGTAMTKEDFRIIHKSAPIIGPSMYAYSSDLPDDLKAAIAKAFIEAPTRDKAAFDRLSDGQKKGFHPATTKDWDATIDLIKFVDNLRKKKAS